MLSNRWLSVCPVLSVTLVYYGQAAGWIKMLLGMEVGLNHSDIVSRWAPSSPLPKKGSEPPIFGPCVLWPNGHLSQLLLSTYDI